MTKASCSVKSCSVWVRAATLARPSRRVASIRPSRSRAKKTRDLTSCWPALASAAAVAEAPGPGGADACAPTPRTPSSDAKWHAVAQLVPVVMEHSLWNVTNSSCLRERRPVRRGLCGPEVAPEADPEMASEAASSIILQHPFKSAETTSSER